MTYNYSNAQFRSILCGLGYLARDYVSDGYSSEFPVTYDNSSLDGYHTKEAIKAFQQHYDCQDIDGILGPETTGKANTEINVIHQELNIVISAGLPFNLPLYGPQTVAAVKQFQALINVPQNGIASDSVLLALRNRAYNGAALSR